MLFSICSLITVPPVWMCHSRALNNKINVLRERCLKLIYNDKQLTFVHIRNLQTRAIEIYKVVNGGSPEIMKAIFRIREENLYNLRHQNTFKTFNSKLSLQQYKNSFVLGA